MNYRILNKEVQGFINSNLKSDITKLILKGNPFDAVTIQEIAEQIEADIVIVGTAARDGIKAAMIGNTAEKILDAIATKILTVDVS